MFPKLDLTMDLLWLVHEQTLIHLTKAIADYKKYADVHQAEALEPNKGDWVLIDSQNMKLKVPCQKLGPKQVGPF